MEWDGITMDELGRFWLVDDEGEPYGGPYDTPEDALAAIDILEEDE